MRDDVGFELSGVGKAQLALIQEIATLLNRARVRGWLFGGWALDIRLGRITREHGDIEFWVERCDGERAEGALTAVGSAFLDTSPSGIPGVRQGWNHLQLRALLSPSDGTFRTQGRWYWVFPAGSFPDVPARLGDLVVTTMSAEGMLAMKSSSASPQWRAPAREGRPRPDFAPRVGVAVCIRTL